MSTCHPSLSPTIITTSLVHFIITQVSTIPVPPTNNLEVWDWDWVLPDKVYSLVNISFIQVLALCRSIHLKPLGEVEGGNKGEEEVGVDEDRGLGGKLAQVNLRSRSSMMMKRMTFMERRTKVDL